MSDNKIEIVSEIEEFKTSYGTFRAILFAREVESKIFIPEHHLALEVGDIKTQENPIVEIRNHNFLGESLSYNGADSAESLKATMQTIQDTGGLLAIIKQTPKDIVREIMNMESSQINPNYIEDRLNLTENNQKSVDYSIAARIMRERGIGTPENFLPTYSNDSIHSDNYMTLEKTVTVNLKTDIGYFKTHLYVMNDGNGLFNSPDIEYHLVLIKGDVMGNESVLVRTQSECYLNESLLDRECDCRQQLQSALQLIQKSNKGVFIYSREDGKGIGLPNKAQAISIIQENGEKDIEDMYDAYIHMGFKPDLRDYRSRAEIIEELGIKSNVMLLTNNPDKIGQLADYGFEVERVPIIMPVNEDNQASRKYKEKKMGHLE